MTSLSALLTNYYQNDTCHGIELFQTLREEPVQLVLLSEHLNIESLLKQILEICGFWRTAQRPPRGCCRNSGPIHMPIPQLALVGGGTVAADSALLGGHRLQPQIAALWWKED